MAKAKQQKENDMKKQIVALALIIGLGMTTVASANWGRGDGYGRGYCGCQQQGQMMQGRMMQGPRFQQMDQATRDKIRQFFKDTQPLHKEMAMKRAEKQALMQSANPDPQAVAKVAGEMFDLRATIRQKAEEAGIDQYIGGGMGRCGGRGRGPGMMGPGYGMRGQGYRMMNNGQQQ